MGQKKLSEQQATLLDKVDKAHLASMGRSDQSLHQKENIKKVVWDQEEKCLKVYYKNGNWWHYGINRTWY